MRLNHCRVALLAPIPVDRGDSRDQSTRDQTQNPHANQLDQFNQNKNLFERTFESVFKWIFERGGKGKDGKGRMCNVSDHYGLVAVFDVVPSSPNPHSHSKHPHNNANSRDNISKSIEKLNVNVNDGVNVMAGSPTSPSLTLSSPHSPLIPHPPHSHSHAEILQRNITVPSSNSNNQNTDDINENGGEMPVRLNVPREELMTATASILTWAIDDAQIRHTWHSRRFLLLLFLQIVVITLSFVFPQTAAYLSLLGYGIVIGICYEVVMMRFVVPEEISALERVRSEVLVYVHGHERRLHPAVVDNLSKWFTSTTTTTTTDDTSRTPQKVHERRGWTFLQGSPVELHPSSGLSYDPTTLYQNRTRSNTEPLPPSTSTSSLHPANQRSMTTDEIPTLDQRRRSLMDPSQPSLIRSESQIMLSALTTALAAGSKSKDHSAIF